MKTGLFRKSIFVIASLFMLSLTMSAFAQKSYIYNTKEENGKIVSKIIFSNEEGILTKEMKYDFSYNSENKVSVKTVYKWNENKKDWDNFCQTTYTYDTTGEIHSVFGMWNKEKKDFSLNAQTLVAPAANYDNIFS